MTEQRPSAPAEIDDLDDRLGAVHPLDFDQHGDERKGRIGDPVPTDIYENAFPEKRVREAGLSGGETPDGAVTQDDLAPETLIREDGARDADEQGQDEPADRTLSEVDADSIGAGGGLDEAEEGREAPLDGRTWDGPADQDEDTGLSSGDAVLDEEDEDVLDDEELEGDAPLDSARDKRPDL